MLELHPADRLLLAESLGRGVHAATADEAEEVGLPWEVVAGHRLRACLGAYSGTQRHQGVTVWEGCEVHSTRWGGPLVRFWYGKPYHSPRIEWAYESTGWHAWWIGMPQAGGTAPFEGLFVSPTFLVRAAVEAACTFRK